jgi:hypothetical protein
VADEAQTTASGAEESHSSVEEAVPSGTEALPPAGMTVSQGEIQDPPPGTAAVTEEDAKTAASETAIATSLAEIGSTESRPNDLKIAPIDKGRGD